MTTPKVFNYHFNGGYLWLAATAFVAGFLTAGCVCYPCLLFWTQMQVLAGVVVFSFAAWMWKYLLKHKALVVTDDAIQIDFCRPLSWTDVQSAQEVLFPFWFQKRRLIVLTPKEGIVYRYNFLQKHNCGFTPFSIPLYALSAEDGRQLTEIVKQKTTLQAL